MGVPIHEYAQMHPNPLGYKGLPSDPCFFHQICTNESCRAREELPDALEVGLKFNLVTEIQVVKDGAQILTRKKKVFKLIFWAVWGHVQVEEPKGRV